MDVNENKTYSITVFFTHLLLLLYVQGKGTGKEI